MRVLSKEGAARSILAKVFTFTVPNPLLLARFQRSCWASHQRQVSSKLPFGVTTAMRSGSSTSKAAQSRISSTISNSSPAVGKAETLAALPSTTPEPAVSGITAAEVLPVKEPIDLATNGLDSAIVDSKPLLVADPFGGFIGHSFLHFCQFVELMHGWTRARSSSADVAAETLLNTPQHSSLKNWGSCSLGTICCTVVAAGLIPLFNASSAKSFLPIPFLLIIVLVAFRFGRAAGVLGTLMAAFLFAYYLFEPVGLAVGDPVAKGHLIWMLVIGIVISDLSARFKLRLQSHRL